MRLHQINLNIQGDIYQWSFLIMIFMFCTYFVDNFQLFQNFYFAHFYGNFLIMSLGFQTILLTSSSNASVRLHLNLKQGKPLASSVCDKTVRIFLM